MALAQMSRVYLSSYSNAYVSQCIKEFDQLFVAAGCTVLEDRSNDPDSMTGLNPSNTQGLTYGAVVVRLYQVNDAFSDEYPIYLRATYRAFKNGFSNSHLAVTLYEIAIFSALGEFPSNLYAANAARVFYSFYAGAITDTQTPGNLSLNQSPVPSAVYLDEHNGRLAVGLGLGMWGQPGYTTRPSGASDTESAGAFSISRLQLLDGSIDPSRVVVSCFNSFHLGQPNVGASSVVYGTNLGQAQSPLQMSIYLPVQYLLDLTGVGTAGPSYPYAWVGGAAAGSYGAGLPLIQPGVVQVGNTMLPFPDVAMYWAGSYTGGMPRGSIFQVNDGVEVYDYLALGCFPCVENFSNTGKVAWAFRLGLHDE